MLKRLSGAARARPMEPGGILFRGCKSPAVAPPMRYSGLAATEAPPPAKAIPEPRQFLDCAKMRGLGHFFRSDRRFSRFSMGEEA